MPNVLQHQEADLGAMQCEAGVTESLPDRRAQDWTVASGLVNDMLQAQITGDAHLTGRGWMMRGEGAGSPLLCGRVGESRSARWCPQR